MGFFFFFFTAQLPNRRSFSPRGAAVVLCSLCPPASISSHPTTKIIAGDALHSTNYSMISDHYHSTNFFSFSLREREREAITSLFCKATHTGQTMVSLGLFSCTAEAHYYPLMQPSRLRARRPILPPVHFLARYLGLTIAAPSCLVRLFLPSLSFCFFFDFARSAHV